MRSKALAALLATVAAATVAIMPVAAQDDEAAGGAQVGVRPLYLVDDMADGELKDTLAACAADPVQVTDFSIGHRAAALQFRETA